MNAARQVSRAETLPSDARDATLVGRAWIPGDHAGPVLVAVRDDALIDITALGPTMADLLARSDLVQAVQAHRGPAIGSLDDWLASTCAHGPDPAQRHLLAPNDLQVVKAAGVTFAASMVERVIEERARGDSALAEEVRRKVVAQIGDDLTAIRPGSPKAMELKQILIEQGLWSQYVEVGIGPDAEIFTKAAPMSSVGTGVHVGLHPASTWNNPEPEIVLAVSPDGAIVGATLGNDVNLRDFEGRSALLLGKAKDNNGACAIGPFIRLLDQHYTLDDVRRAVIDLEVIGADGYQLHGSSSMALISRDPSDLAAQAIGPHHQYPDGLMLFCGTMFAPVDDRDAPGQGFTHHLEDRVAVTSERLGGLVNWVGHSDRIPPWTFGIRALMASLARQTR